MTTEESWEARDAFVAVPGRELGALEPFTEPSEESRLGEGPDFPRAAVLAAGCAEHPRTSSMSGRKARNCFAAAPPPR